MIPDKIYEYCRSSRSVSSELVQTPDASPGKIAERLYHRRGTIASRTDGADNEKGDLERAYECGNWGANRPSDLFLQIYHDSLCSLRKNPLRGVVSPSLMGSHGVVPLTIIAPLSDIFHHIANCIVRAEKEIFLAANFWRHCGTSVRVTDAFRELSRRAGERGTKVVVKMLYDRATPKQFVKNHYRVSPKEYTASKVQLPPPEEIPNVDLQVLNFHRPIVGLMHSKFAVFDRRVALLYSSNIQDTETFEMLTRVEGPIVDSFYDSALIIWKKSMEPPLPMLDSPAAAAPTPSFSGNSHSFNASDSTAKSERLSKPATEVPQYDPDIISESRRVNANLDPKEGGTRREAAMRHLNTTTQPSIEGDAPESDHEDQMTPYILHPSHDPFPMALVNRDATGTPRRGKTDMPQNAAFLSAINNAKRSIFIQTQNMNAEPIIKPLLNALRRGVVVTVYLCLGYNDAGQLLPFQNGTNEMIAHRLYTSLQTDEERSRLHVYYYVAKDQTKPIHDNFRTRSCHVKLMIIDESVAIQGNGNLDTQSLYHSQEINLLLDSPSICRTWLDAIDRNENTKRYGLASKKDGFWHDPVTGGLAEGSMGADPGMFGWVKGIVGTLQRVKNIVCT